MRGSGLLPASQDSVVLLRSSSKEPPTGDEVRSREIGSVTVTITLREKKVACTSVSGEQWSDSGQRDPEK